MLDKPKNILVVHSSAELYGSDKSLLDFVRNAGSGLRVTVALPESGPLVKELEDAGATVVIGEVCKIQRLMFTPIGISRTLGAMRRTYQFLGAVHRATPFDLVYSNSLAVLGGALCARLWHLPHVWHVREIMSRSNALTFGFRRLVAWLSSTVVCNSQQTLEWIRHKGTSTQYKVIWNGFEALETSRNRTLDRAQLGAGDDDVLFVLVGRVNWWKGQSLLVQAFSQMVASTNAHARLAIVGSAPVGQEHYETALAEVIAKSGCASRIVHVPYRVDINPVWNAADVVVVPSTEPEPFGRVAIEAMGFGKPVIAAAHGGLLEIVDEGVTGLLVRPCDPRALAGAMEVLLNAPALRQKMGEAGRTRQGSLFSVAGYASQLRRTLVTAAGPRQKTILFVHQAAEMYGSDKVLLALAMGVRTRGFHPIVLLPEGGPLLAALKSEGVEVHVVQVAKLTRSVLSVWGLMALPFKMLASVWQQQQVMAGRSVDLVYSNTLAVLGGVAYAKFRRIPHLWHVHELLLSPNIVNKGFPWMVRMLADRVVCNSNMTAQWLLQQQPDLAQRTSVIWNGLGMRPPMDALAVKHMRATLCIEGGELLVAMVGRINRWKGQELLVEAATLLWNKGIRNVHFVVVGGVYGGQVEPLESLKRCVAASPAGTKIHLMPFTDDIWSVWDACDIAVVPSTEPEPFGLVAIEAMAATKPVVVAAHGGLLDIVEDESSGLLFIPKDALSFATQLERLVVSADLRDTLGKAGAARQIELFSLDSQINRTVEMIEQLTNVRQAKCGG